ncbi:Cgl0159 family (beta/alpha)8-fold protein [Auraticoccus monumenti]|uniref:Cgl0159-like domain-containing protein n=1 Tax=Auraticoccus monumenti TaxID=675864 RepID=A0A1G6YC05_9ACTN|nr:hypothetical protein [Auraticoccus monumenti]SDD88004.1 hypothetical protein SAMN04489747_1963 [Auraticoccus monumenti]
MTTTAVPTTFCRSYEEVTTTRVERPQRIAELAATRRRRPVGSERLMIVAADHPARGALSVAGRPMAMSSRTELLDRLRTALARPGVDGVLATADVLEDLLLLGALEDKLVLTSMNRGGLAGSSWEVEDRFTAVTAEATRRSRFDGGKMLARIDLDDDRTSLTLEMCARVVDELAERRLIALVEPFLSSRVGGRLVNDLSPDAVIRSIHIAQALGSTSAWTWLKLPAVDDMERVMDATTLPSLLLGGDPGDDADAGFDRLSRALRLHNVRGLVLGRSLLYPADDDVAGAVDTAVGITR